MNGKKIEEYLDTRIWEGCSGSYAIDGEGDPVVQVVRGSVSNIVGLPMESLTQVLNWLSQKKLAHARNEQAEIPSLI
jgi:septum formation protein